MSPVSHHPVWPLSPHLFIPDLFKYRLINCKLINSTFLHNKEGCLLSDVSDENNAYMVYFVSFLGTLAVLPGNIVSALLMDKIGRLRMLGNAGSYFSTSLKENTVGVTCVLEWVLKASEEHWNIGLCVQGIFITCYWLKTELVSCQSLWKLLKKKCLTHIGKLFSSYSAFILTEAKVTEWCGVLL